MKIFASGASGASSLLSSVRPASLIGRKKGLRRRKPVVEKVEKAMSGTDVSFDGEESTDEGRGGGGGGSGGFSLMEKSETVDREEEEADREFHEWFAMDKKEVLLERELIVLFFPLVVRDGESWRGRGMEDAST